MSWQDAVIAVGQVIFVIALIPALLGQEKPPRSTCWVTGVTLASNAVALLSLGLVWSGVSMGITAACWLVLGGQWRQTDVVG
jgi:hypothetical protein